MMNLLLASTSTVYGGTYLDYLKEELIELFKEIEEILFIPYARPNGLSHEEYTSKAREFFSTINKNCVGINEFNDPIKAIQEAQGFFTGGGNTFLLVKQIYEKKLLNHLKDEVKQGKPYLGTSAGSNIAGLTMKTTNDMPIVYPPSFDTMGLVPFNINAHYLDPVKGLEHNGETRETRILEYLSQNDEMVIGLREGNWIRRIGDKITIGGHRETRIFEKNKAPYEVPVDTVLSN